MGSVSHALSCLNGTKRAWFYPSWRFALWKNVPCCTFLSLYCMFCFFSLLKQAETLLEHQVNSVILWHWFLNSAMLHTLWCKSTLKQDFICYFGSPSGPICGGNWSLQKLIFDCRFPLWSSLLESCHFFIFFFFWYRVSFLCRGCCDAVFWIFE